jgi:hypothetical protein
VHAVLDALAPFGIAHLDMPLTPQKIWAAIQTAHANSAGPAACVLRDSRSAASSG